jgi:hypothetical protein
LLRYLWDITSFDGKNSDGLTGFSKIFGGSIERSGAVTPHHELASAGSWGEGLIIS